MVEHQSKEVVDKMSEELKIQPALQLPKNINPSIQPVYVINPVPGFSNLIQVRSAVAADSLTSTIHTCHATKDTFIVAMNLSVSKDGVNTSISSLIKATPFGDINRSIIALRYEPSTAESKALSLNLVHPIKLERGSLVTVTNNNATASIDASGIIYFYEVDPQ